MTSKRQLRADLERAQADSTALARAILRHVDEAEGLGHEAPSPISWPWQSLADRALASLELLRLANVNALQADNAELRAKLATAEDAAAEERVVIGVDYATPARSEAEIRRDTLEKVIEALELNEYRDGTFTIFGNLFTNGPERGSDRFWDDITTALRVRAEDAEAEADEAAEARIAAITRPERTTDEVYSAGETIIDSSGRDQ